jgi:hypothetical protein
MAQGDINTAITPSHKHGSKHQVNIPPVYMQQDQQHEAMIYIHYDLQPYKEVDVYQTYHHNYTTQNNPLHTEENADDEESLPSILCPGEYEDDGFSDDEESVDGQYHNTDPMHNNEYEDNTDCISLPRSPTEDEATPSDKENSRTDIIPHLLERGDESDNKDDDSDSGLEIPIQRWCMTHLDVAYSLQ